MTQTETIIRELVNRYFTHQGIVSDPKSLVISNLMGSIGSLIDDADSYTQEAIVRDTEEKKERLPVLLSENPEYILALVEEIEGSKLFQTEFVTDRDFARYFQTDPPPAAFVFAYAEDENTKLLERVKIRVLKSQSDMSLVGFVQLLLRFVTRFGDVKPGDIQEFRRFNSYFYSGILLVNRDITPFEELMLLAADSLGCLVVSHRELKGIKNLVHYDDAAGGFEKIRKIFDERNYPYDRQALKEREHPHQTDFRFEAGGTIISFFVVRAMGGVDGVEVRGAVSDDMGIIIDIGDPEVDITMTLYIEQTLIDLLNRHTPLRVRRRHHSLVIGWANPNYTALELGSTIYNILKENFNLTKVSVNVLFDRIRLGSLKPTILSYIENRSKILRELDESNSGFYLCTRCKVYAHNHFCILTPDRPPMCGRTYIQMKTLSHITNQSDYLPVKKGDLLDRRLGEYLGINKIASLLSNKKVQRVFLHSILNFPHPNSAEYQNIAFHIEAMDGIGLMHREFEGHAPDGHTWQELELIASGKQSAGAIGVSDEYILSPSFLQGDGGFSRIIWITQHLKDKLGLGDRRIATERECSNLSSLERFYSMKGR